VGRPRDFITAATTAVTVAGSTAPLIRTRTPPLSAISIDPAADLSTAGFASIVGPEITGASGTIWTGTKPAGGTDDGGAMAMNRRRHLNSMLAFTSCRRATNATEAPRADA